MLDTFIDLVIGVQDGLTASGVSTFYAPDKIKRALQKAYSEAISLYQWPMLEKAKEIVGGTVVNQYYYDYPLKLMSLSITRVIIDGIAYEHKDFDDFLNWKYQTPNKQAGIYIFANYGRQFFIDPTSVSQLTMFVWGSEVPSQLVDDNDPTIFTNSEPMGNEAIVKIAMGKLLPTANKKKEGQAEEAEGAAMLGTVFQKIQARKMMAQRLNKPMFQVPDLFRRGTKKDPIGNFNL